LHLEPREHDSGMPMIIWAGERNNWPDIQLSKGKGAKTLPHSLIKKKFRVCYKPDIQFSVILVTFLNTLVPMRP
jgi:hypothetical protein